MVEEKSLKHGGEAKVRSSLAFANVTVQSSRVTAGSDGVAMFCFNAKMSRIWEAVKRNGQSWDI